MASAVTSGDRHGVFLRSAGSTRFFKMSGAGNDFIGLTEPEAVPSSHQIQAWCQRGLSIGADGVFILERLADADHLKLRYFNADGRAADLCLNATRCAAQLAFELGWAEHSACLQTDSGLVQAQALGPCSVRIEVPKTAASPVSCHLELEHGQLTAYSLTVGVPHLVVSLQALGVDDLGAVDVNRLGQSLRSHADFGEAGTNVDFVHLRDAHRLEIRTYERGVEGETLACGTGVIAASAVAVDRFGAALPLDCLTSGGCVLSVDSAGKDRWALTGDARLVAEGWLLSEAGIWA